MENEKQKIIIILIGFILVISSIIIFVIPFGTHDKKIPSKNQLDSELDDRISPLTNQGLILEIKRIRHRGLLNQLLTIGPQWRKKPLFFLDIDIDGMEYSGRNNQNLVFNTWDTIFEERRLIKDVREEQFTSNITVNIFEQKELLLRPRESKNQTINLIYDYKTGRWTGDDHLQDIDGYGHVTGDAFEIWFNIYQTDYDQDYIPYWTETNIINTNPQQDDSNLDPDGDGIPTSWEYRWGYNPFVYDDHLNLDPDIDGIENIEEYQMAKYFADPFSPDIYLEVDGMQKKGFFDWNHILYKESQQALIERFCQHGINLYIDSGWETDVTNTGGELLPHKELISWDAGTMLPYYTHHFTEHREEIFRYCLIADKGLPNGFCGNTKFNRFDTIMVGTNKITTFLQRTAITPRTWRITVAAALMHELGHSLGIGPNTIGGCDNFSYKNKIIPNKSRNNYLEQWGNYKSVMNYYYIYEKSLLDYSDGTHGKNDQNDWKKIFLPTFQIEHPVICEPNIPINEKGTNETITADPNQWTFDKNLTKKYYENITNSVFGIHDEYEYKLYIKSDESMKDKSHNLKIYCKPKVPISTWSLIKEITLKQK